MAGHIKANEAKELPRALFHCIFNGIPVLYQPRNGRPRILNAKRFTNSNLRYLDVGDFRYVEQNPATSSKFALLAREGKKILWIIRLSTNQFVGRVEQTIAGEIKVFKL